jgi:predicted ATP-grasp superfamily ATP-dependent carboligase
MRVLRRQGFATPETRATRVKDQPMRGSWLLKPRRSGGGHGTAVWRIGQPVPRTHYLQERIVGIPGSVVFAADGTRAAPLGLTRQLVGDARFGASRFRYCGSLLGPGLFPHQEELLALTARLATTVTQEFGLVGLNGIDFIARNGIPYPIEVNPRYCASMELIERAQDLSIFELHAQACQGILPATDPRITSVQGKAIVFARRPMTMGDTRPWVGHGSLADVPQPGESIRRGHPICTVFAHGRDRATCRGRLVKRAARIYRVSESRKWRAA